MHTVVDNHIACLKALRGVRTGRHNRTMVYTPETIKYTARSVVKSGREGKAVSSRPQLEMSMAYPPELGGDGDGTNPEQLFSMAYGACFQGAMGIAAKELGMKIRDNVVGVAVGIGPEGDSFAISVDIEVYVPGLKISDVQKLAERTHELCPYSKATRGNVVVNLYAIENAPRL